MEEVIVETVETKNPQEVVVPQHEETADTKKPKPQEVLRELSKTFSLNLFDEGALDILKEKLSAQSNSDKELKTKVEELSKKELLFAQKEQEYQVKITALGLGFSSDQLDEVLALAKVNTKEGQTISDGLKVVKEKYGSVFATTKNIGLQLNDIKGEKPNLPRTEQERYIANNSRVQAWERQKNKPK